MSIDDKCKVPEILVRRAETRDIRTLAEFMADDDNGDAKQQLAPLSYIRFMTEKLSEYCVAEIEGKTVGCVRLRKRKLTYTNNSGEIEIREGPYISGLYTNPEFRRRGVSKKLVDFAENVAAKKSRLVYVVVENQVLNPMFISRGYELLGTGCITCPEPYPICAYAKTYVKHFNSKV